MLSPYFANGGGGDNGVIYRRRLGGGMPEIDLRDSIAMLVAGGYKGLSDERSKAQFNRIANIVGPAAAQNIFIHIAKQNSRPEFQAMKPVDRVTNFYDIRSNHLPTDEIIQKVKALGTGPEAAYQQSSDLDNQRQQGFANAALLARVQGVKK